MPKTGYGSGGVCLSLGILFSGASRLLDRLVQGGPATEVTKGALDGISVVALGAAIAILASTMGPNGRSRAPGYTVWR
jgi:hypothetical protein